MKCAVQPSNLREMSVLGMWPGNQTVLAGAAAAYGAVQWVWPYEGLIAHSELCVELVGQVSGLMFSMCGYDCIWHVMVAAAAAAARHLHMVRCTGYGLMKF